MKEFLYPLKQRISMFLYGLLTGVCVGLMEVVFGYGVIAVTNIHHAAKGSLVFLLPLGALFIGYMYRHQDKKTREGLDLLFEVEQEKEDDIPLKMAPMAMIGAWISHLCGASTGRAGACMQIGASVSMFLERRSSFFRRGSLALASGVAAGFSGLFGLPMTSSFLALEIFRQGALKIDSLLSILTASYAAYGVSYLCGLHAFHFDVAIWPSLDLYAGVRLVLCGIVFGCLGGLFAWCLKKAKKYLQDVFPLFERRIIIGSLFLLLMLLIVGTSRYGNTGEVILRSVFEQEKAYPWDWILKFVLTIITSACGFIGGEVTPMFSIGASLGFFLGPIVGLDPLVGAAIGMAAFFGAESNTYLAPMALGMEIFGYGSFPFFFIACSFAYLCNGNQSVYRLQMRESDKTHC